MAWSARAENRDETDIAMEVIETVAAAVVSELEPSGASDEHQEELQASEDFPGH